VRAAERENTIFLFPIFIRQRGRSGRRVIDIEEEVDQDFSVEAWMRRRHSRYFDPVTEDFISQDPKGFGGGSANLYQFGNDNPVSNTDPTGLEPRSGLGSGSSPFYSGPVPWGANLAPQAGSFGTGQTPWQTVPGTAYTPWWQSVARAAAAAPAPAAGPSIVDWVAQQTTVPADIAAAAPSAASIIAAETEAADQRHAQLEAIGQQAYAEYNPNIGWNEQAAQYAAEDRGQAQIIQQEQQQAELEKIPAYQVGQALNGALWTASDITGVPQSEIVQSVQTAANIVGWAGVITPPVFGFAGSVAAGSDAALLGSESFLGGEALGGGEAFGGANLYTSQGLENAAYTAVGSNSGVTTAELRNLGEGVIDNGVYAPQTAESLVTWIDEGGNLRLGGNPGMSPAAYEFQSGTVGARSNLLTGRSQAPYLEFMNEAGQTVGAKFDGVDGLELIDRKLNPFFNAKAVDQATRQAAVAQYYGLQTVWEFPTSDAVSAANRFMQTNNITGITVRLGQ
jgi:RHS repeat-associated protein